MRVARSAFCNASGANCAVPGCSLLHRTRTTLTRKTIQKQFKYLFKRFNPKYTN